MKKDIYKILLTGVTSGFTTGTTIHQLPIYLEEKFDNMGVMTAFDGEIEHVEQYSNFTYSGYGQTIIIYNTTNTNKFKSLSEAEFTIDWGDDTSSVLNMPTVYDNTLPSVSHVYGVTGDINISVTINSPWKVNNVKKTIKLPFKNVYVYPDDFDPNINYTGITYTDVLGTLTYNIPYTEITGQTQEYLQDYTTLSATTEATNISFIAAGKSRLNEFKVYGNSNSFVSGFTLTYGHNEELGNFTGYTIDGLSYFDYDNGYTHITGTTSGTTQFPYVNEELYNGMLTRHEILLGFVDEPQIYSDLFVERGKQSIIERNLRLGEIDNMGELEIYGGGYFKVKKQ